MMISCKPKYTEKVSWFFNLSFKVDISLAYKINLYIFLYYKSDSHISYNYRNDSHIIFLIQRKVKKLILNLLL